MFMASIVDKNFKTAKYNHVWDIPMYPPKLAGKLVGLTSDRVKRWLQGYDYSYVIDSGRQLQRGHQGPVVRRDQTGESMYASFLDLIDLIFVKSFLDRGVSLQKLRRALRETVRLLDGHHFAQRMFFTDGKKIYLKVKDEAEDLLELLSGGQWAVAPVIRAVAQQIVFDKPTGFARKWYPLGKDGLIVLDPAISFGRPTIIGHSTTTANVYDLFVGESENAKSVCSWLNLKEAEVAAAVNFERTLKAA